MFLLVLVLPLSHTRALSPAPSVYPPCASHTPSVRSRLPLQAHARPCAGSRQPLPPSPGDIHRQKRMLRGHSLQRRAQMDCKAHPPPLIRLRSESTSSAPSIATSSCRKRRNLVWKLLPGNIQALLSAQLGRVSGPKQHPEMLLELRPP